VKQLSWLKLHVDRFMALPGVWPNYWKEVTLHCWDCLRKIQVFTWSNGTKCYQPYLKRDRSQKNSGTGTRVEF